MKCPQCQQVLTEGARFCAGCGLSVAAFNTPTEQVDSAAVAAAMGQPLIGQVLDGKYELSARLGAGGMGAVYRARRVHIGDEVAVKVLHPQFVADAQAVERFRREARAAAELRHPHVVTIHDFGEARGDDAPAYIVMELVEGTGLRELLRREGRLAPNRAVALMQDICAGVGAAHRRGTVHRDLKPDNIIVLPPDAEGGRATAKVVDFGIAKLRDTGTSPALTAAGTLMGTPYYMSPEQCRGEALDARADVYSLGALLYEMLAGTPPFTAETVTGVISKHLVEPPPMLPAALAVPPALAAVCLRSLAKDPAARPADATALRRELQTVITTQHNNPPQATAPAHAAAPAQSAPAAPTDAHAAAALPTATHSAATPSAGMPSAATPSATTHPAQLSVPTEPRPGPPLPVASPPRSGRAGWVVAGLLALLIVGGGLAAAGFLYLRAPATGNPPRGSVTTQPTGAAATQPTGADATPTAAPTDVASILAIDGPDAQPTDPQPTDTPADAAADAPPSAAVDAAASKAGPPLTGRWTGSYGPLGQAATLLVQEQRGAAFSGVLTQGAVRVAVAGRVETAARRVSFKETRLLSGDGWSLGAGTGTLSADGRSMSGTGQDPAGAQLGMSYQWAFTKQ